MQATQNPNCPSIVLHNARHRQLSKQIVVQAGVAAASDMGPCAWPVPNTLWTQVMLDFGSSGSGVCAIGCGYHEVSMNWLDRETLEITYPQSAILRMGPGQESGAKIMNRGSIVNVIYVPRAT